jgi:thiamine-phosphate diphosphorylase
MPRDISGFYFITDSNLTKHGALKDSEDAIKGGARIVQYREKEKNFPERVAEALEIQNLCRENKVIFIVNDDLELVLAVCADGLHIGPHDIPPEEARKIFSGILGVSCGTVEEVRRAEAAGADYIAASPVFFTSTKDDIGNSVGLEGIMEFRKSTELPIVAIRGINLNNLHAVMMAGANSVCAISATVGTSNVEASVRKFVESIAQAR